MKLLNFIGVLKYKLTANELDNYNLFKEEGFIQVLKINYKIKFLQIF